MKISNDLMEMWGKNCEAIKNVIEGTLLLPLLPPSLNAFSFFLLERRAQRRASHPTQIIKHIFRLLNIGARTHTRYAAALPAEDEKDFFDLKLTFFV